MKKIIVFFSLLALLVFSVGCGGPTQSADERVKQWLENDFELVQPTGEETEIQILFDSGINPDSGYPESFLPKAKEALERNGTGANGVMQYFVTKTIHNFNIENNNVHLNYLNWGWGDSLTQKLSTAFVSQMGPSIIVGESQMPGYAQDGLLTPFPDDLAQWCRENLVPAAYKAMEFNGKIYGVTPYPSVPMLFWNKTVLRNAGVDEKYIEKAPATWDEFLAVAKVLRDKGYSGGGLYCGDDLGGYLRSYPFILMNGGDVLDGDTVVLNSEKNVQTLEYFRKVAAYSRVGILSSSEEALYKQFNMGRVGYIIDGSWRYENSIAGGIENIGYGRLPSPTGNSDINVVMGANYYSVPNYATNKDLAFKVIQSFLSKEVQWQIGRFNLRPVVNKEVGESEDFKQESPVQVYAYDYLKSDSLHSLPTFAKSNLACWQQFGKAIKLSVTTTDDITDLLTNSQQEIETILR